MSTILIYEPNRKLAKKISDSLTKKNYLTLICSGGDDISVLPAIEGQAMLIVDTQLKWTASRSLLEMAAQKRYPILFLTENEEISEHIKALYHHDCEVLHYPCSHSILLRTVRKLMQKEKKSGLVMDQKERTAELDGKKILLTAQEYALLAVLMEFHDTPVSREYLLRKAWGYQSMGETRTVDVHVQRLRKKFGSSFIETVYKCGYRLNLA